MKKILFSVVCLLLMTTNLMAQIRTTHRIELPVKDGFTSEQKHLFGKNGLVQTSRSEKSNNGERIFRFVVFDESLREKSVQEFNYPKNMSVFNIVKEQNKLFVLFVISNSKTDFILLSFDILTEKMTNVSGNFIEKFRIGYSNLINSADNDFNMLVNGDNVYISGAVKKVPTVCIIDSKSGDVNDFDMTIDGVKPKKVKILNAEVLPESQEVVYYVMHSYRKKIAEITAKIYTLEGKLKTSIVLNENGEHKISRIAGVNLSENEYAFSGTYGSSYYVTTNVGMCYFRSVNGDIKVSQYFNFLDFQNYLKFLPEKVQDKINKQKERKEARGKELTYTTGVITHPLIITKDGIVMLMECFYPTYRTVTTYSNGRMSTSQVFDGYKYTHGVMVSISDEGKVLWDNIFELALNHKPYFPRTFITVNEDISKEINMVYSTGLNIYKKSISLNGQAKSVEEKKIDITDKEGDKVKSSYSNVEHWYDNYFLMYGVQSIKNSERDENGKKVREVIFMNKIEF